MAELLDKWRRVWRRWGGVRWLRLVIGVVDREGERASDASGFRERGRGKLKKMQGNRELKPEARGKKIHSNFSTKMALQL